MMGGSVDKQNDYSLCVYLMAECIRTFDLIVNEQSPKTLTNPRDLMVPTLFSATQL